MTNFLQRLATTVIAPRGTLQPLRGSVFAPVDMHPIDRVDSAGTASTFAVNVAGRERRERRSPDDGTTIERDTVAASRVASPPSDAKRATALVDRPTHASTTDESKPAAHRLVDRERVERDASSTVAASPLVTIATPRPDASRPPESTVGRRASSDAARRAAARDPDEVHIHIGRIEVAAVAPPAAPANRPAPVRRGLDLSEYLKHGRGSGR